MMPTSKPKREKKKPKQLREAEKAHDAGIYGEGYKHGYDMGYKQALKDNDIKRPSVSDSKAF